jgi:hypothetical protein
MAITYNVLDDLKNVRINDFYNSFHNSSRTQKEFDWEFCDGPAGRSIYIHALTEEGKIAGALSVIPLEMTNGSGQTFLSGKPEDSMIDIFARLKYRKTDIFKEMYDILEKESKERGIEVLWGFTYETKTFKRLGFDAPFHSLQGIFVLKPFSSYRYLSQLNIRNRTKEKIQIAALVGLSFISIFRFHGSIKKDIVYDDFQDHQQLLEKHLNENPDYFCLDQSPAFMDWRIRQNPNKPAFKIISLLNSQKKLEADIIYSVNGKAAFIEQIIYDRNSDSKRILKFLKTAIIAIKKENVSLIRFMGFDSNPLNKQELRLLKKAGFYFVNRGIPFVFKKIGTKLNHIDPSGIFLSRLFTQGNL